MFTKILVPLDGSEIAAKVLPKVVELAKTFNAKVTLFHACYSGVGAFAGEGTPAMIRAEEAHEKKFCDTFLAQAGQSLKAQGLDADWFCEDGVPAREIIAFAQDKGYDLIDCISFSMMETFRIQEAFGFDKHFAQCGFRLLPL